MAKSLEAFKQECVLRSKSQIKSTYKSLQDLENKNDLTLAKLSWLESRYPTLSGAISPEQFGAISNLVEEIVPYQVQLAEKYINLFKSAKRRGKEFNLEIKDVHSLLKEKTCFYTGKPFGDGDMQKTVDRVDNNKGYIKGNVVACSKLANQLKEQIFERPTNNLDCNIQFIAKVAETVLKHTGGYSNGQNH